MRGSVWVWVSADSGSPTCLKCLGSLSEMIRTKVRCNCHVLKGFSRRGPNRTISPICRVMFDRPPVSIRLSVELAVPRTSSRSLRRHACMYMRMLYNEAKKFACTLAARMCSVLFRAKWCKKWVSFVNDDTATSQSNHPAEARTTIPVRVEFQRF